MSNKSMHYADRPNRAWLAGRMHGQTGSRECREVLKIAGSD